MDYTIERRGPDTLIILTGPLTGPALSRGAAKVEKAAGAARGGRVVADLRGVKDMDTAGVGLLFALYRRALMAEAHMALVKPPARFGRLMAAAGIERFMRVYETRAEALRGG